MDVNPNLREAVTDYFYLLNKQYPEQAAITLVGNRYRLNKDERTVLFRGVTSLPRGIARRAKLATSPSSIELHVDGYNVLFTLLNYRLGKLLFIGNDGYLRDAGGTHGRFSQHDLFLNLAWRFLSYLAKTGFSLVHIYLDAPVSHSALHAREIRECIKRSGMGGDCTLCESVDYKLKHSPTSCIATSDTAIVDALPGPFFDAARGFLEKTYQVDFFDLSTWVSV